MATGGGAEVLAAVGASAAGIALLQAVDEAAQRAAMDVPQSSDPPGSHTHPQSDVTGLAAVVADYESRIAALEAAPPAGEAFPVGSVFTAVVSTDPATLLGYGTWSAFGAGRVLVGLDSGQTEFDTVEETGGAKTHTLAESEIPSHTHTQDSHNHTQDAHLHSVVVTRSATTGGSTTDVAKSTDTSSTIMAQNTGSTVATNQAATAVNQNTGGGGAHNNLQPYIVVYMWKRTA